MRFGMISLGPIDRPWIQRIAAGKQEDSGKSSSERTPDARNGLMAQFRSADREDQPCVWATILQQLNTRGAIRRAIEREYGPGDGNLRTCRVVGRILSVPRLQNVAIEHGHRATESSAKRSNRTVSPFAGIDAQKRLVIIEIRLLVRCDRDVVEGIKNRVPRSVADSADIEPRRKRSTPAEQIHVAG